MQYTQEITLDLNSNTAYTTVGAKQGDNNSRVVSVHITKNGIDYDLQAEGVSSAYFRFRKPDGKAIINTATIDYSENVIKLVFTAQTLAASGRGYADITLLSGSSILSTVSFIIIIMSSPQVANQAVSSDEFGYLNRVVEDATHTIYNAEAWAAGTRGGQDVFGEDLLPTAIKQSEIINAVTVDQEIFKNQVGEKHGTKRIFTFSYNEDGSWNLITQTIEGASTTESSPEIVSNIYDYGIVYSLVGGADTPNKGDKIIVTVAERDDAYRNNAKYYARMAENSKYSIEELTTEVEIIDEDDQAYVEQELISEFEITNKPDYLTININRTTFIDKVEFYDDYVFIYNDSYWLLDGKIIVLNDYGITISGAPQNGDRFTVHFKEYKDISFYLPRGRTGNVNFMVFEINPIDGQLWMYRPGEITQEQLDFSICEDPTKAENGQLMVMINTEVVNNG